MDKIFFENSQGWYESPNSEVICIRAGRILDGSQGTTQDVETGDPYYGDDLG